MAAVPPSNDNQGTPTRPYLLRALHEWCTDNGFTPYLAVYVDASVRVPEEHVKNNEIVLNVSVNATSGLRLGNEFVEFKTRFGRVAFDIMVPVDHVIAIYARENGQGMAFPAPTEPASVPAPGPSLKAVGAAPGLRLASDAAAPEAPPVTLAADTSAPGDGAAAGSEPEPPDTPPPTLRPSLKRVK